MKMANLMVAITSATLLGLFTLPESSSAQTSESPPMQPPEPPPAQMFVRRRGNTYSQTGSDEQNLVAEFNLVDTTQDGQPIGGDADADSNVRRFIGAIENFTALNNIDGGGRGVVCVSTGQEIGRAHV